jgi:uncharacterized OB-fold protein
MAAAERIPIEAGFFTIPSEPDEAPRLLGSRCRRCSEVFFPRRAVCARCLHEELAPMQLGPRGTLWTYTWCHVPLFGALRADVGGYGVGQVDLPEGPRVQSVLSGVRGDFRIGMEMELDLEVLRRDGEGREVVIFRFRPIGAASAELAP